jgi:hypothetical protein
VKIVNLTPHTVTLFVDDDRAVHFAPSGTVARCTTQRSNSSELVTDDHGSIPVTELSYGEAALPLEDPTIVYIVSILVAQSSNRRDLYVIDEEIRNAQGIIIGAKRLARLAS